MNIVQLLLALLSAPQDEIIKPALPYVLSAIALAARLGGHLGPKPSQYAPCKALFDGLHHGGRIASFRLAEQQMEMLGHDDVAHYNEMIAAADILQHFKKRVAPIGIEQRAPLVTTGGDVVQVSLAVAAIQVRHVEVLAER